MCIFTDNYFFYLVLLFFVKCFNLNCTFLPRTPTCIRALLTTAPITILKPSSPFPQTPLISKRQPFLPPASRACTCIGMGFAWVLSWLFLFQGRGSEGKAGWGLGLCKKGIEEEWKGFKDVEVQVLHRSRVFSLSEALIDCW